MRPVKTGRPPKEKRVIEHGILVVFRFSKLVGILQGRVRPGRIVRDP